MLIFFPCWTLVNWSTISLKLGLRSGNSSQHRLINCFTWYGQCCSVMVGRNKGGGRRIRFSIWPGLLSGQNRCVFCGVQIVWLILLMLIQFPVMGITKRRPTQADFLRNNRKCIDVAFLNTWFDRYVLWYRVCFNLWICIKLNQLWVTHSELWIVEMRGIYRKMLWIDFHWTCK